jgi:hypothetical protein
LLNLLLELRDLRASGGFKEQDPAGLDDVAEVGVADGAGLDQVDRNSQEGLEILLQSEEVMPGCSEQTTTVPSIS